jgi:hypothetical protein
MGKSHPLRFPRAFCPSALRCDRVQGNKKIGIADLSFSDPFNAEQKPLNALKIVYGDLDLIRLSPFTLPDSAFTLPPPAQQCERSHRAKQRGGGLGNYGELSHVAVRHRGATCKIRRVNLEGAH